MKLLSILSSAYLLIIFGFFAGVVVTKFEVWPYHLIRDVYLFVQGDKNELTTLMGKIRNDADLRPDRFLHEYSIQDVNRFTEISQLSLRGRRVKPVVFSNPDAPDGYIYVTGKFDFLNSMEGVLLFSTDGQLLNVWEIPDEYTPNAHHHLFHMLSDGSIVSALDNGVIYKYDFCGQKVWTRRSSFHHSISKDDDGLFWVSGSIEDADAISKIDLEDGSVIREIPLSRIHDALDPEISFLEWGQQLSDDPWHNNDVEPLSAVVSDKFPQFNAGDLLISYRHANVVYVVDHETLQVKWWTQDFMSGQHDPDWNSDGTITVFNNRLRKKEPFSDVIRFDFIDPRPTILLSGQRYNFKTGLGGKHQVLADKSVLALSYDQGRVIWVDQNGDILFEFVNRFSKSDDLSESLAILNTGFLPLDYFEEGVIGSCS